MRTKWSKFIALTLALALVGALVGGCAKDEPAKPDESDAPTTDVKAAMVTDVGGLGDKSFNDLSYAGLKRAEKELGVEIQALESKEQTDYENNITQLVNEGFNPIFAVGFLMTDSVIKLAPQYTDTTLAGIDIFFEDPVPENVLGLNFREQEAAYLAGVVAGMLTTRPDVDSRINDKKVVGFVGGMEVPAVVRFRLGFEAGVKSVDPSIEVKAVYTGSFTDMQKGAETAKAMIESGADIIFAAAGQTGAGSFTACKDEGALFIGVDADQYNTLTDPGDTIITSAIKRVDNAVFDTIKAAVDGTMTSGKNMVFGLAEEGVGLADWHDWDSKMPKDIKDAVDKASDDIVAGTVTVPSN